jgi:hypothetical protein
MSRSRHVRFAIPDYFALSFAIAVDAKCLGETKERNQENCFFRILDSHSLLLFVLRQRAATLSCR